MAEGGQVMRKKAPAFTVDNIMTALKDLESRWWSIGDWLFLPDGTLNHIKTQHSTNGARLREVLHYFLSLHPYPGWRIIIWYLHWIDEQESAARIQEYAEPVTDTGLSVGNVAAVMSMMKWRWNEISPGGSVSLASHLVVPWSKQNEIRRQHQPLVALATYCVDLLPGFSWSTLAGALYYCGEEAALQAARRYIKREEDTSLSVGSVAAVMSVMKRHWDENSPGGGNSLADQLSVPWSKRGEIKRQHQLQQKALAKYCVDLLPGFSWSTLAGALYYCEEEAALQAARRYIKREEDPTLNMENLLSALQPVTDWNWLGQLLDVPLSRLDKMTGKEEMLQHWLLHHPCGSWKVVTYALYKTGRVIEHRVLKQLYGKYVTGPPCFEMERRLNACRRAIAEKGAIDQIIMQGVFLGLPRSGKTSSKKRLVGKRPTPQQASTGVVEKVTRIEIEKTTVFTWNEVTELNEETALVVEDIVDHVTTSAKYHIPNEGNMNGHSDKQGTQHEVQSSPKDARGNKGRIRMIVKKVKAMFARKHRNMPPEVNEEMRDSPPSDIPPSDTTPANQLQVLSTALQVAPTPSRRQQVKKWTVYLSDAGGQPEFQEMLPALVSGPSLYFLTFPLNKGLDERFVVEYQHPNGNLIKPFELTSTTKEVLLQSLASIASTQSYSRVEDGKSVSPKILFIATHQDKVESDEKLLEIDKNLQDTIRKTIAFKENMIVFCSEPQMIFPINNMSDNYDDIQQVKNAVERIGFNSEDYKITTPCTWMIFAITLRHLPERVLSFDQCIEIGKECGIDTQEEMNDALWFLHHNVGILRHFQTHPQLRDVVIKDPQYIFDKVTELIISTFTFEKVGPYEHEQFSRKGIFSGDALTKISMDSDILTSDKFALLLVHLHILASIELDGNDKYFAPSALTHADLPPQTQMQPIVPPLVVNFECGFCPRGMFGSLVASLLKKDKLSEFDWKLEEESIYRNQICLSVGPYDSFQFSLSSKHVTIALKSTTEKDRKIPLHQICCDVRCEIEQSIHAVIEVLHYTEKAKHAFAFACPEPPPHDQSHAAVINFSPRGEPCNLTCPFNKERYDLPEGYLLWFDEKPSLQVRQGDDGVEEYVQSGLPSLSDQPKLHQLDLIEGNEKTIRAIEQSAAKWEKIATRLYFESCDISRIKKDHNECDAACQTVFVEWLNGRGRKPINWNTLIKVLNEAGLAKLATDVKLVLS